MAPCGDDARRSSAFQAGSASSDDAWPIAWGQDGAVRGCPKDGLRSARRIDREEVHWFRARVAVAVNSDVIVLCHGGPIAEPADARYVLGNTTGVAGFFGASSMERLPTEIAITERVREFKALKGH